MEMTLAELPLYPHPSNEVNAGKLICFFPAIIVAGEMNQNATYEGVTSQDVLLLQRSK